MAETRLRADSTGERWREGRGSERGELRGLRKISESEEKERRKTRGERNTGMVEEGERVSTRGRKIKQTHESD